jgi:hypothetical protein
MSAIETMNTLLGSNYQVVANGTADPVVLAKLPGEYLTNGNVKSTSSQPLENTTTYLEKEKEKEKTIDDYVFQLYLGSLTVVGLFVLFRMIQKSK